MIRLVEIECLRCHAKLLKFLNFWDISETAIGGRNTHRN